jgi:hypothetical protein
MRAAYQPRAHIQKAGALRKLALNFHAPNSFRFATGELIKFGASRAIPMV